MAITSDQALDKVKEVVPNFGVDADEVTLESTLEALDMDSLDVVEVMQAIEDDLGVQVPDADLENISTIGDAIAAVVKNS